MLKRIFVTAACAVLLAGVPAQAVTVCDSNGIEYNFKLANGEFIFGTASNLPCGGTASMVGSFTRVSEGFFFSIFVDQNVLINPEECCEGYEIIGVWSGVAGNGNWYNSREEAACNQTGVFTIGTCTAVRSNSEAGPPQQPGLKY